MRTAFGLVSRDENLYVHEPDERFLARLPADLADEVRRSPMGYAWPVDDVMATFERLSADWHGRDDRIRIVTAPDWTPACSDELYRRCRRVADEHGTGIDHARAGDARGDDVQPGALRQARACAAWPTSACSRPQTVLEHFVWVTDEELADLRGLGRGGLQQPRLEPAAVQRASAGCATSWTPAGGSRSARTASRSPIARTSSRSSASPATCSGSPTVFERQRLDSEAVLRAAAGERRAGARAWRTGSAASSPGRFADLLIVDKERILFPPGPLRRRAVPRRRPRPGRVRRHRHGDGARPRPDGGRPRHRGGRGRA